jgi:hypothetical protein
MNRTVRRETKCRQAVHKLITSLQSIRYLPPGMVIHRQNSYSPRGKQSTGGCEAQSRETVNKVKKNCTILFDVDVVLAKYTRERIG